MNDKEDAKPDKFLDCIGLFFAFTIFFSHMRLKLVQGNITSIYRNNYVNNCGELKKTLALDFYWKINPRTFRGFKVVPGIRTTFKG